MDDIPRVKEIMTRETVSVRPETFLTDAAEVMAKGNLSGLPVVDGAGKLLGILTEYDLLTKGAQIHLPTFVKLLSEFPIHRHDTSIVRDDLKKIFSLTVRDVMNDEPLVLEENATIEEAVLAFANHHRVNPIPIVDSSNMLVGVVSRYDIIKFYSPFPSRGVAMTATKRNLDKKIDTFLNAFEKKYILVSKLRSNYWIAVSFLFAIVGFFVALALLARIVIEY